MLFADTGAVTDSYDYTAFGEIHGETGTTDNAYKFTGEQYDSNVGQYYLRARYYNQAIGRFTQMDTYQGSMSDPASLHKYLYTANDPVNMVDPTGRFGIGGVSLGGMGVSLSTAVSAINTGYRVIGTLDTILSFYQSLHTMYTVMSNKQLLRQIKVLQNSNHKKAEEFVNAVSRTTDALVHLSSNLGKLFTELKNSERVKQFAKNFNFPLVIYGPTPDKTVPWPLKLRMKIGKIGSSRKGRNIILEIGSGKKDRGGRMFGLGHIEGKRPSAHDKQWFRQDWHKTHNAKDLCRTTNNNDGYHYHCMQK
ncbi:MAG: hypothetical protein CSA42_08450 [Gammaproteobacteria bacterium]|nr:MAG: hypothetical protein CSA42_08450 [Gammaproteobacteria bacterium]